MQDAQKFSGWRMVALGFIAQNLCVGLVFGTFGAFLATFEAQLGLSRAQSASGLSAALFAAAVGNTVLGSLLARRNLRWVMAGGMALQGLALIVLASTQSYAIYLMAYAVMGASMGAAGVISPLLLARRWFNTRRGTALGIINLPLALALYPLATAYLLTAVGSTMTLTLFAGLAFAGSAALALLLIERPEAIGQAAYGEAEPEIASDPSVASAPKSRFLLDWRFWLLAAGLGVLNGTSGAFVTHIVPFAVESGYSAQQASSLVFVFGIVGIIGVPFCGWLSDQIGAATVLAIMCGISAVFWWALNLHPDMLTLIALTAVYGAFLTAIMACQGAAVFELFKPEAAGQIVGTIFLFQIPLLVGTSPFVGSIRESSGSYQQPFTIVAAVCVVALASFMMIVLRGRTAR